MPAFLLHTFSVLHININNNNNNNNNNLLLKQRITSVHVMYALCLSNITTKFLPVAMLTTVHLKTEFLKQTGIELSAW
jgi:hypothetical protein